MTDEFENHPYFSNVTRADNQINLTLRTESEQKAYVDGAIFASETIHKILEDKGYLHAAFEVQKHVNALKVVNLYVHDAKLEDLK